MNTPPHSDLPRLYLLDGMALLFRSFYAMGRANLSAPDGTPTGAVFGFMKILVKILKEQNPTHVAVTWDRKEKTFRHERYADYKGTRSETPAELLQQIPLIQDLLVDIGVPSFSLAGYEGDDLIGSFACAFEPLGDVFIVSSDKDFMQLVNDRIKIFSLKSGDQYEVLGREHVVDYFGVPPEKVIEVLALTGDKVDNVPGVKGIGEKGAAKLISEFGSLQGVYDNIDRVANARIRGLLQEHKGAAFLSRELVTIECKCPLGFAEKDARLTLQDFLAHPNLRARLEALRMGSIVRSLYAEAGPIGAHAAAQWPNVPASSSAGRASARKAGSSASDGNAAAVGVGAGAGTDEDLFGNPLARGSSGTEGAAPPDAASFAEGLRVATADWGGRAYELVNTRARLDELCARIASNQTRWFAFDTETTGLDVIENRPIGVSVSFEKGSGFYVPAIAVHLDGGALCGELGRAEFSEGEVFEKLGAAFRARTAVAVAHNLKFDLHMLRNVGVALGDAPIADTMVAAWLLDPAAGRYGLDGLTLRHLQLEKIPTSALIGKEAGRASMTEVPLPLITEYACEDVDATLRLWEKLEGELRTSGLESLFSTMEMPLLRVLADMERVGVHIDSAYLAELAAEVQDRINAIETQVYEAAGERFNLGSPKQLGAVLFERLKVHEALGHKGKLAKTTLGFKTDAKVLEQFEAHPVVALVQDYRELSKLLNTYILVLPQLVKKSTGRIHTQFNQIGTATGRLSSTDPNLQNIPVRTELGKKVRKAFTAETTDAVIVSADYSQVELRVLAHLSGDENMISAFRSGADIHRETAAKILGKTPEEVTAEERSNAKSINFGIIYGMGAQRLARDQKITLNEAKAFIEKYFMNFAKIRAFLDNQRVLARETGRVLTHFGRPRPVDLARASGPLEVKALENIAINSPIQGTAADIMKLGMLRAHKALEDRGLKTKVVLQVHDELVLEGPRSECVEASELVRDALQGAVQFSIPLSVDVSQGENWLEAK